MVTIPSDVKNFIKKQRLGFVATVSPDNTPNVSPKGTIFAWDDSHLIFADIKSPQTMSNLQNNPAVEINIVDPLLRRGYRFKGNSKILSNGNEFEKILSHYKENGIKSKINAIVIITVDKISEITSPLYDLGHSEKDIKKKWKEYYLSF